MAKQGMHENDHNDPNVSKGHNNPYKSVEITTGTPKKPETYAAQAREIKTPAKSPSTTRTSGRPIPTTSLPKRTGKATGSKNSKIL